jgi:hypothetical protein
MLLLNRTNMHSICCRSIWRTVRSEFLKPFLNQIYHKILAELDPDIVAALASDNENDDDDDGLDDDFVHKADAEPISSMCC